MRDIFTPATLAEYTEIFSRHPHSMILAGGTDLLVKLRGKTDDRPLIMIDKIAETKGIDFDGDTLRIGAGETFGKIATSEYVNRHAQVLALASAEVGGPALRNMATIGGNICTASPAGDSLPALYILEAVAELYMNGTFRRIPINELILSPSRTAMKDGELLTAVYIPSAADFNLHHFEKTGTRKALVIAVASLTAMVKADKEIVSEARFAWGSVAPTVARSKEAEDHIKGKPLTAETLMATAKIAGSVLSPIDDHRASAEYRRTVSKNLLMRLKEVTS